MPNFTICNVKKMLLMQYVKLQFLLVPKIRPRLYSSSAGKIVVTLWDGEYHITTYLEQLLKILATFSVSSSLKESLFFFEQPLSTLYYKQKLLRAARNWKSCSHLEKVLQSCSGYFGLVFSITITYAYFEDAIMVWRLQLSLSDHLIT